MKNTPNFPDLIRTSILSKAEVVFDASTTEAVKNIAKVFSSFHKATTGGIGEAVHRVPPLLSPTPPSAHPP